MTNILQRNFGGVLSGRKGTNNANYTLPFQGNTAGKQYAAALETDWDQLKAEMKEKMAELGSLCPGYQAQVKKISFPREHCSMMMGSINMCGCLIYLCLRMIHLVK
jgi:hypothetical protein